MDGRCCGMDLRQIHTEEVFDPLLRQVWMSRSKVKCQGQQGQKTFCDLQHPQHRLNRMRSLQKRSRKQQMRRFHHCQGVTSPTCMCWAWWATARSFLGYTFITPPFPEIDIIRAVVIVWRVRGKIIRYVMCNIVCNNCAQCDAHTLWTDLTVLWIGFCLTGPISMCLDSFLHVLCVLLYTVCMCRFVTWWGGPDGIEAYP